LTIIIYVRNIFGLATESPLDDGNESSGDFRCTPTADIVGQRGHVRKVPESDIAAQEMWRY
jgi:hypothetical protein